MKYQLVMLFILFVQKKEQEKSTQLSRPLGCLKVRHIIFFISGNSLAQSVNQQQFYMLIHSHHYSLAALNPSFTPSPTQAAAVP
jgi:hypothetical protein